MKKKRVFFILIICTFLIIGAVLLLNRDTTEYVERPDEAAVQQAFNLLCDATDSSIMYSDYIKYNNTDSGSGVYSVSLEESPVLDYEEKTVYSVTVEKDGMYNLQMMYRPNGDTLSDFGISISINGEQPYHEMKIIALPLIWEDVTKDYPVDSYGDESAPKQSRSDEWNNIYLYSNTYSSDEPLCFYLKKGENIIEITNIAADGLELGTMTVSAPDNKTLSYSEYLMANQGELVNSTLFINATDYISKNSTQAIYETIKNPALEPYDAKNKVINVLTWTDAGTEVTYEVEAAVTGYYNLTFHYRNKKEEYNAFESIYIDGEIPFEELRSYAFAPTGTKWANETLSDSEGNPFMIYLTAGVHTLTLKEEQEPVIEAWRYGRLISEHISQFALEITKITGSEKDENRTWKMTKYIPEMPQYLEAYKVLIQEIRYLLQDDATYGINSALLSDLDKAMQFIDKIAEYPDEIALHTAKMTGRDSSILVVMSNFTSEIIKTSFSLDGIYLYGGEELPKASASWASSAKSGFLSLVYSFTDNKYSTETDDDTVTVWVNRALTHVDLLQKMVDTDFTPSTGIKVKIAVMPDANKLTMAAAADETPDIALGLASYMPFDLACRGALYDMTQFEDFWVVADRFVPGAFVSYVYNEGVYAIPETLNFYALAYRKDIFDSLGFEVPDTWQDVIDMLPELQRYGMNFYHNVSSGVGYKWFYQTTPLILQNNGRLYSDNGLTTAIDEPNSVKGLQALGNLFIAYSLDTQVISFFNSFRYSILPIGIMDSNDYILLKNGAPELEGQWALAAYPGTEQEDGSISRWYVANGTGGVIFDDSEHIDESWEFLKWWTSRDTQVDYTYTLRSTYGKQFFWLPSNVEALEEAPIEQADKVVILEQVKWLRDVPRTPGQYLLERSISDIWNTMVLDGTSAQVAIDEKTIDINREIKKKMEELGYYDDDGNLVKEYVIRDIDWIQEQIDNAKEGE